MRGDQLVPGRRHRDAELVEHRLVRPDPVGRVDVDRRRDPVAVVDLVKNLQRLGHHRVPAVLGRGRVVEVGERALLGPVEDVEAEHLHRRRRVARGDARPQHRHRLGAAAAGDRHVLPADALGLEVLLQDVERRGLAAARSTSAAPPRPRRAARLAEVASAASAVRVRSEQSIRIGFPPLLRSRSP